MVRAWRKKKFRWETFSPERSRQTAWMSGIALLPAIPSLNEWKNVAPCHPKQQAVDEFFRAKKAALSNVSAGNASWFKSGLQWAHSLVVLRYR